jgi:hypothetical protein
MDKKITEYKVVMAKSPIELTTTINQMLTEGWIPTGGIFITQSPITKQQGDYTVVETYSHQAMIKVEN